jgi:hypothetical protein
VTLAESRSSYEGDPASFVVSMNIARRHLSAGQRAMLAVEVEAMHPEGARASRERAEVHRNTINCARFVKEHAPLSLEPRGALAGLRV